MVNIILISFDNKRNYCVNILVFGSLKRYHNKLTITATMTVTSFVLKYNRCKETLFLVPGFGTLCTVFSFSSWVCGGNGSRDPKTLQNLGLSGGIRILKLNKNKNI